MNKLVLKGVLLSGTICWAIVQPAVAQVDSPGSGVETPDSGATAPAAVEPASRAPGGFADTSADIIVTARKREESLQNVPVVVTVVPAQQLQRLQVVDLKDITKLAPGLLIGTSVLSVGQQISIRGVGTSSADPGIDQSVSLNIDGLPLTQGLAYSSGLFDVGQVEVLKGPQALFFGKSSPGGVISLRTADPTDAFELSGSLGYEAEARTRRGELIVSGPLTDTLKGRLAGAYTASQGFYYNDATALPGTGAVTPRYSRLNRTRGYQVRGTLVWDPTSTFNARLKINLVRDRAILPEQFQLVSCPEGVTAPLGTPFIGGAEDCTRNRHAATVYLDPANFPGIQNSGVPFVKILQRFGTLELNDNLTDQITLTSVTGYYNLRSESALNTSFTTFAGPLIGVDNPRFRRHDFTQEVRLNTDFSAPLNFTAGGFYQDAQVSDRVVIRGNTAYGLPAIALQDGVNGFSVRTYSLYGQGRWQIMPELELAAGVRWTDETRRQSAMLLPSATLPLAQPLIVTPNTPRIHSSNFAPEVTLTWRPTADLTVFAAYKKGYKSGSFTITTPPSILNPGPCLSGTAACSFLDNSFGDESVEGGEAGIKGRLIDHQVTFALAGYNYRYKGLQVGATEPVIGSIPIVRTINAGSGRAYGVDFTASYRPRAIEGLGLNGSVNWNHARFKVLDGVPCYGGQTVAAGCNQQLDPTTGHYFAQDLSGSPFVRAPNWQATFGIDYTLPVGGDKRLILTNSNTYSSRYLTILGQRSDFYQSAYLKTDLGITLQGGRDIWEVALIGKNLTNRLTAGKCDIVNAAGGLSGGQVTGATTVPISGPAGEDEVACYLDTGRELWLRLTIHFPGGR